MSTITKEYQDLNRALDEVHDLCEKWAATHQRSAFGSDTFRYVRLVLYEWIANLHQHACFEGRTPTVRIQLRTENRHVYCEVEDNSDGFDLAAKLPTDSSPTASALPEHGMGLRIMDACTGQLSYDCSADDRCRLVFSIPADHDPWLTMRF